MQMWILADDMYTCYTVVRVAVLFFVIEFFVLDVEYFLDVIMPSCLLSFFLLLVTFVFWWWTVLSSCFSFLVFCFWW
jgi:hypothetical protein